MLSAHCNTLAVAPTGFGKTVVLAAIIGRLLAEAPRRRRRLCEQLRSRRHRFPIPRLDLAAADQATDKVAAVWAPPADQLNRYEAGCNLAACFNWGVIWEILAGISRGAA